MRRASQWRVYSQLKRIPRGRIPWRGGDFPVDARRWDERREAIRRREEIAWIQRRCWLIRSWASAFWLSIVLWLSHRSMLLTVAGAAGMGRIAL